jgi:hypothetical protein
VGARRHRWALRALALGLVTLALVACSDDDDESDRGVVGPGVEIHCADQLRLDRGRQSGIGDTSVDVACQRRSHE